MSIFRFQLVKVHQYLIRHWFLVICISAITVLSCKNEDSVKAKVFHYNQHNPLTSLDPAFAKSQSNIWPVSHLYSTLVTLDDSLNIIPDLAKSWNISDDGLEYSFIIKRNVFFHEDECFIKATREVSASDFVFSFNRIISKDVNSPGSWIFKGKLRGQDPFTSQSDSIFKIHLDRPFGPFLSLLTMQYCSVVPEEAVQYYGTQFFENPVGTGPFKFVKWLDKNGLFLKTNSNYHYKVNHNLDGIRTSFIPERSIALLEIINGNLDYMSGLEASYVNTALDKKGEIKDALKDRIQILKNPYLNFEYLGINQVLAKEQNSILQYKEVRQALNWAIDRTLMLNSLRNGVGAEADSGVIPKGLPSYDSRKVQGYGYDIVKAKNLLNEIKGIDLSEEIVISTSKDYLDLTTFIARQWEELGLNVKIDVMESAILRDKMRSSAIAIFRASWIVDYPDGENYLSLFYSKNPAPPNYTRFGSDKFDILYEKAILPLADSLKIDLYHSMNQLIVDDAPVIFLFYDETANFYSKNIFGMPTNAINFLNPKSINL